MTLARRLLALTLLACLSSGCANGGAGRRGSADASAAVRPAPLNPSLRLELLERMRIDQQVRREMDSVIKIVGDPQKIDVPTVHRWQIVDQQNTAWLKPIIKLVGWPGYKLVGEDGAQAAWILVQHADQDPEFQREMLPLLEKAVAAGDASPRDLAALTNRVRWNSQRR